MEGQSFFFVRKRFFAGPWAKEDKKPGFRSKWRLSQLRHVATSVSYGLLPEIHGFVFLVAQIAFAR